MANMFADFVELQLLGNNPKKTPISMTTKCKHIYEIISGSGFAVFGLVPVAVFLLARSALTLRMSKPISCPGHDARQFDACKMKRLLPNFCY
jgi:hypothetical protein